MAELRPIPFSQLLRRVREEPVRQGSIFDLPLPKAWRPRAGIDCSVEIHGHRVETPVGPAAGPHAQLAQNIVLSWLAGSRVIELKTVQILDELEIPRPCIDAATIGFNVEWSQELKLEESLREYVVGWMLLRILRELDPLGLGEAAMRAAEPVFELSVGYDLKGLTSTRMREYLTRIQNVAPIVDELRGEAGEFGGLDYRADMVSCVTLSTFHGCPPDEIEKIARYLLNEIGVDVIVKLNPTLLGFEEVTYLLRERMGYHELRPRQAAFDGDLKWHEAIDLGRRLSDEAARLGRSFGVKMTNTLVVDNHKSFFKPQEMYLSGAPLHVLAMHCVERWRNALGVGIPLSFSGGIDQHNFTDAVACGLVPVTTCTDLLRPGGYARLPKYLGNLADAMVDCGAATRDELILKRFGKEAEARRLVQAALDEDRVELGEAALRARVVEMAGLLNTHEVVQHVTGDPRYAAGKNAKPPRKVGTTLVLLDCLSCDKCVPVCPNDANFSIPTAPEKISFVDLVAADAGVVVEVTGGEWVVKKPEQWANFAEACNECGNCDVFCPEDGGPYVVKARFFGARETFERSTLDGLHLLREGDALWVEARLGGARYRLRLPGAGAAELDGGAIRARYDVATGALISAEATGAGRLSGAVFLTLRALVRGVTDPARMNPVSAAL
jgi:putative selenate reductase